MAHLAEKENPPRFSLDRIVPNFHEEGGRWDWP